MEFYKILCSFERMPLELKLKLPKQLVHLCAFGTSRARKIFFFFKSLLFLPARQTQISSSLALLVFWKRTRGTRRKRVVSPCQSACRPENEQTKSASACRTTRVNLGTWTELMPAFLHRKRVQWGKWRSKKSAHTHTHNIAVFFFIFFEDTQPTIKQNHWNTCKGWGNLFWFYLLQIRLFLLGWQVEVSLKCGVVFLCFLIKFLLYLLRQTKGLDITWEGEKKKTTILLSLICGVRPRYH